MIKEIRRAKRTKRFYLDNNVLPLSIREKKKVANIEYQNRVKLNKAKNETEFKLNYKNDLFNYHLPIDYNYSGSLTYKNDITMFKAYKNATYVLETLKERGLIDSYFMVTDFEINHVHTHYIIKSNSNQTALKQSIYLLFNRYDNYNFLEQIKDEIHKENILSYLTNKLNIDNKVRQSNVDYWYFN